tara:strand:+ start:748 stop:2523 length:1776 start_codon:yes stop_codon:yes gene_type:complete
MIKRDLEKDIIRYGNMGYDYKPFLNNGKLNHRIEHKIKHKIEHKVSKQVSKQKKDLQNYDENRNDSNNRTSTISNIKKHSTLPVIQTLKNPLKASLKEMPADAKQRAELVKTSSVLQQKGLQAAQKRMQLNSPNYELDIELSNDEYIVAKSKETGKIEIAFRGTDPNAKIKSGNLKGFREPVMWAAIMATGMENNLFDQHNMNIIKERIQTKYDLKDINHISGYSMGGTKAHKLATDLNVDSTLLNPLLGKNFYKNVPTNATNSHTIIRTTEDIATLQGILHNKSLPKNVTIDSIDPIATKKVNSTGIQRVAEDVVALHDLDHFVEEGNRKTDLNDAKNIINEKTEQFIKDSEGKSIIETHDLREELIKDLEPHLKVISNQATKVKAHQSVMRGATSLVTGGAGLLAGVAATESMNNAAKNLKIDALKNEYLQSGVSGAVSNVATEKLMMNALGGASHLYNFKNAVLSGGASALLQTGTSNGLKEVFANSGIDKHTSNILSETIGGGIGGASQVAIPMAVSNIGKTALLGTAEELVPLLGAEAIVAETNFWNPIGWIAGGTLVGSLVAGGIQMAVEANNSNNNENENENEK